MSWLGLVLGGNALEKSQRRGWQDEGSVELSLLWSWYGFGCGTQSIRHENSAQIPFQNQAVGRRLANALFTTTIIALRLFRLA